MKERYCALSLGVLFLALGIAGCIPNLVSLPSGAAPNIPIDAPSITYDESYGYIFGLFATNSVHNFIRLLVGLLGVLAYTTANNARIFNRSFAVMYALLAFMGLFPYGNTVFGLMPIYGHNIWVNALTAVIAAYYGFVKTTEPQKIQAA